MDNCSFCGTEIDFGTGKMFVKKDAKILYFCSRRCEKNMLKLKRNPRNVGFTVAARQAKRQHMATMRHEEEDEQAEKKPVAKKTTKKAAKKEAKE